MPRFPFAITTALGLLLSQPATAQSAASPFAVPAWAFPTRIPAAPQPSDSVTLHTIPGSALTATMRRAQQYFDVIDWLPETHGPMPPVVRQGRPPDALACGSCHMPNGAGRPENATLAGLPPEYLVAQLKAFRDSSRWHANPAGVAHSMYRVASTLTDEEAAEAARYFASLTLTRRNRVIESERAPRTRIRGNLYEREPGNETEPVAGRLIEFPEEFVRHELRDPRVQYITYAPPGSLARGEDLVTNGPAGPATTCATCHGPALRGVGAIPPIAGRSPSYILRQLVNFRTGARHEPGSELMRGVVGNLSIDDMVALAAYVGSLEP